MSETTILIVDDESHILRLCQWVLHRAGFLTLETMDPTVALAYVAKKKVDLLLCDINMPVMDGFELVAQAKKIKPDLPVLLMTGYGTIENAVLALHRGVDGLVLKPFDSNSELVAAVRHVLEEKIQKTDAARGLALRPLLKVTEDLFSERSVPALEELIFQSLMTMFQSCYAGIFRYVQVNGETSLVRSKVTHPIPFPEEYEGYNSFSLFHLINPENNPYLYSVDDPGAPEQAAALLRYVGWSSAMVAPVFRENTHVILSVGREASSAPFSPADLELLTIFANQAGVALENARLYNELQENMRRAEESQRALIQTEKMAAVGRLMASLAHEINNPLQAVRNCIHLAARFDQDSEQRRHYLALSEGELDRLATTIRRMLDFYRPGGTEAEIILLQAVVDNVLGLIGPQLKSQGIKAHVASRGELLPVLAVPDQIQQVIFNLLINSMDALEDSKPGRPNAKSKEIWIDLTRSGEAVKITIEDSGPGLAAEVKGRLFEPFISTKPEGSGLGLAVSYDIIQRNHGDLAIIPPRHGQGACFEITLPAKVEEEYAQDAAQDPAR